MNENIKDVSSYVKVTIGERSESASVIVLQNSGDNTEITIDKLYDAIVKAGIRHGIRQELLKKIVDDKLFNKTYVIALFTPPAPGKNGSISYRFDRVPTALLVENEDGNVNYRELGLFKSVTKGTVIADITPPEAGVKGVDVLGRDIVPSPVSKASFTIGVGTVLSDDGLQIIAAFDGVINYEKQAFVVKRDLNIRADIDFNTGNIKFKGNINIRGNVGEGFKVESTGGNVVVYGAVFSGAEIKAAGNITLNQVCNHAIIRAGGNVTAAFCEYCDLFADGDITAQTLVVSTVYCGGTLICKGKGGLVGGHYIILSGAVINGNVGSPNYPQTEILLGNNTVLADERDRLHKEIVRTENEIIDLTMIVDYLNDKKRREYTMTHEKEHMLGESVRARIIKNRTIKEAQKRINEIDQLLQNVQDLRMTVGGTVFSKTRICINTVKHQVKDDRKSVTVYVDKDNEFHFDEM
jgi:uncharacterized protein (DUF342 family)